MWKYIQDQINWRGDRDQNNAIVAISSATTVTAADSGKTYILSSATGFDVTMPAPLKGLRYKFFVGTAITTTAGVTLTFTGNIVVGQVVTNDFSGTTDSDFEASGADVITFVINKAVKGDWVDVICDGTNWYFTAASSVFDAITIS